MEPIQGRKINCRNCRKATIYGPDNPFRPFCSERCRLIDLGEWASENHRLPSEDQTPEIDANFNEDAKEFDEQ